MPESYDTAMRRLRSMEKKLASAESIYIKRLWYLPHFAVTHPQKKKVRLVFDAAARTNGKCLNDALLGPRFNKITIGCTRPIQTGPRVSADIGSRNVPAGQNQKEDRDSLRFLWRNNMNENPQKFELEYPEACKAIRLDHYVDDFLKSFNSIEEAKRVSKQVYEIHRKAAFELRGWASNGIEVLNEMPDTRNDDNVCNSGRHELKKPLAYSGTSIMTPWVSISACGTRLLKFWKHRFHQQNDKSRVQSCPCSTRSV
ncbi:hypothetical protein EVAR_83468_1 [Eumeta japonica]|uniref:Uncharacterized protein n=1 Tax=Eumeta variegata TaxID=151549 RepID=A0A4C1ZIX8_EUMVA|nr:hypothetical protein EVAR_83468_1 [Eumeta japonica]